MKSLALSVAFLCALAARALAWGPEGHSIVAEIAQEHLSAPAANKINKLLKGRSLASVATRSTSTPSSHGPRRRTQPRASSGTHGRQTTSWTTAI